MNGKDIGDKIKLYCKIAKITLKNLPGLAGLEVSVLNGIRSGKTMPTVSQLKAIADALGIELVDLVRPLSIPQSVRFRAAKSISIADRSLLLYEISRWLSNYENLEDIIGARQEYKLVGLVAYKNHYTCVTNDKCLRKKCQNNNVETIRSLQMILIMNQQNVISVHESKKMAWLLPISTHI